MAADAVAFLKRLEDAKTGRAVVEDVWRECYRYTYPLLGASLETMGVSGGAAGIANASTARERQADLLDTTGTDGARILASALMAGLTPSNARWPGLEVDNQTEEEKQWLSLVADQLWKLIHASNYDAIGYECMLNQVIAGMFAMYVTEAEDGGFHFEQWALSNTYFSCSKNGGPVDVAYNEFKLTAEQAVKEYGEDMVSEKVRKAIEDGKPHEMFDFARGIYPRTDKKGAGGRLTRNLPFESCHVEVASKKVVRESGYHEFPLGVPRWNTIPGSVYAFGPVSEALPDLKTLNETISYELANMDLSIAGMYGAVDDGVLNARSIKVGPRKVIVMAAKDNFWPIKSAGEFKAVMLETERLQRAIRKVLMADQLEPQQKAGTPPTATEMMVRVELIRQLLGPIYGRMLSEYLQWLVTRCFGIAFRAGAFPQPPRTLMNAVIRVKYYNPMARAQKATDVAAMDRYENTLLNRAAMFGKAGQEYEQTLDNYAWDKADRRRADLLGVPADLVPDEDEVKAARDARAKAAEAQALQQAAVAAAGQQQ